MRRIAVLDDYLGIAEDSADWASLPDAEVTFFRDTLLNPDELVERLTPFYRLRYVKERLLDEDDSVQSSRTAEANGRR